MTIEKAILSAKEPKETNTAWVQPKGDSLQLNIFNNGKWRPIAGGGNSTTVTKYPVDPDAPLLSMDNISEQLYIIAGRLGFTGEPTQEQMEQICNELKLIKFATFKQGNAVLVDYDLENNTFTFQCDDGSIITIFNDQRDAVITGLRPDIDGYVIWKTTRDKLPVRESQEETDDPGGGTKKLVKSGPSLKVIDSGGGSEEVYTVINNNTGEIVDPLELHKLTNIIWYWNEGYLPLYVSNATDVNSIIHALPISEWVPLNTNSVVKYAHTFYDYTITLSDE